MTNQAINGTDGQSDDFENAGNAVNVSMSWTERLQLASLDRPIEVGAVTFIRAMGPSFSSPVQLKCDDGHQYIVKSPSDGLATSTEQIVAMLARQIQAPVPEPRLVRITQQLLDDNPTSMQKYGPGLCHGLRFVPNCTNKLGVAHQDIASNRVRFASLAVLYGWFHLGGDHQFFYDLDSNEVHSFDHGFFFPSGPNWSEASLAGHATVSLDQIISAGCNFTDDEGRTARSSLVGVNEDLVASAVMAPPPEWPSITASMRERAAEYLMTRCETFRA